MRWIPLYFIPDKVKLATKRRWNSTNATSNGAATKKVPAAMTPHSDPASAPEVKDARPTVSTWVDGDEVAISGQRNSFQCDGDGDDGERGQSRARQRQQHAEDDGEDRGAVEHRGFLVVARNGAEGLPHQEHAERRGAVRRRDAGQRVVEVQAISVVMLGTIRIGGTSMSCSRKA